MKTAQSIEGQPERKAARDNLNKAGYSLGKNLPVLANCEIVVIAADSMLNQRG